MKYLKSCAVILALTGSIFCVNAEADSSLFTALITFTNGTYLTSSVLFNDDFACSRIKDKYIALYKKQAGVSKVMASCIPGYITR